MDESENILLKDTDIMRGDESSAVQIANTSQESEIVIHAADTVSRAENDNSSDIGNDSGNATKEHGSAEQNATMMRGETEATATETYSNSSIKILGTEVGNDEGNEDKLNQNNDANATDCTIRESTARDTASEVTANTDEETAKNNSETTETRSNHPARRPLSQGPKHYIPPGWVYHGENDGYQYYVGCAGEMYSVDRDGYWYEQDSGGNFVPYTGYQYSHGHQSVLFPRDSQGRFVLPTNARGEKAFPVDANNMPIFPFDTATHLPTFPVDENGQPVFPTGGLGRPIVPVDTSGMAIFPRDANGRFIFPSGPDGKPTAPVNVYGVPVMPLDEHGKPVVPYDASGMPLIHLASDGVTPLTEEEYQYSLQWNDYYSRYYKSATNQKPNSSHQSVVLSTAMDDTYEQKAKNMKILKKVRPEDIDLPPTIPPPPTTHPLTEAAESDTESGKSKIAADPALKAKTKRMIEMQLKFSRKKLRDVTHLSAPVAPSDGMSNALSENVPAPLQPSSPPGNGDKIESPKERPPPPPMLTTPPIPPVRAEVAADDGINELPNALSSDVSVSKESVFARSVDGSSGDAAEAEEKAAAVPPINSCLGSADVADRFSSSDGKLGDLQKSETSFQLSRNATASLADDKKLSGRKAIKTSDACIRTLENRQTVSEKVAQAAVTDVSNETSFSSENVSGIKKIDRQEEDSSNEKRKSKTKLFVDTSCEAKYADGNEVSQKRDDEDESVSVSGSKRTEALQYHDEHYSRDKKQGRRRRSRSRSSYRDSRRRSRSREFRYRSHSRTPQRDYYSRVRYRSRSRDRPYRQESCYCDHRSHRGHRTPDTEDRHSNRRRRSSSRDKRSTSRDRTPTVDKSSRSRSHGRRKSRSLTPIISSRHSLSVELRHESKKSSKHPTENVTTTDDMTDMRKSVSRSASPCSDKSSTKAQSEVKAEKSKKHKKTKEKHKKRKKSHHKKRERRKRSTSVNSEERNKASSALSDETKQGLHVIPNAFLNEATNKAAEQVLSVGNEGKIDNKLGKSKKKEKRKRREECSIGEEKNEVVKRISDETLEEGEIVTEKDLSPRGRKKLLVNYATSESDGEDDGKGKAKNTIEQLAEMRSSKAWSYADVDYSKESEAMINSTNSSSQIDVAEKKVTGDTADESNVEEIRQLPEPVIPKQDRKITMELEDDGGFRKLKDLIGDSNELTAREAEKLKTDSITEAMNKLKTLRGHYKAGKVVSNMATETLMLKQASKGSGSDSAAGYNLADVPLPGEIKVASNLTERAEQAVIPEIRTPVEASTSGKIELVDKEAKRKKEILKRKWEEDEEDELSRLRYEALRSKTRRLMNDLRAERRRLKRERLRATIALQRARERSGDTDVDEILLADTSDSTETDDSDDYSPSHKRKVLKRKCCGGGEAAIVCPNKHKLYGVGKRGDYDAGSKQHQENLNDGEQLELNAPNNLILALQQRIGGSNESAMALLEQLKKCLTGGPISSNIHVNPEVIKKNS